MVTRPRWMRTELGPYIAMGIVGACVGLAVFAGLFAAWMAVSHTDTGCGTDDRGCRSRSHCAWCPDSSQPGGGRCAPIGTPCEGTVSKHDPWLDRESHNALLYGGVFGGLLVAFACVAMSLALALRSYEGLGVDHYRLAVDSGVGA